MPAPDNRSRTSHFITWRRAKPDPRPDYDHRPATELFLDENAEPLFWVTTAGSVPSEGIFTLIAEAPRIRDELDASLRNHRD